MQATELAGHKQRKLSIRANNPILMATSQIFNKVLMC